MSNTQSARNEIMIAAAAALESAGSILRATLEKEQNHEQFEDDDETPAGAVECVNASILLYSQMLPVFNNGYGYQMLSVNILPEGGTSNAE